MFERIFNYFVSDFRGAFGLVGEILRGNKPQWNIEPTEEEVSAIADLDDPLYYFFEKGQNAQLGFFPEDEPSSEEIVARRSLLHKINLVQDEGFVKERQRCRATLIDWSNFINNYEDDDEIQAKSLPEDDREVELEPEGEDPDEVGPSEPVCDTTD